MKFIDATLNRITMYRLVAYVLSGYVGLALIFALLGKFSFGATELVASLALLLIPAFVTDKVFSRILHVPTNTESWLITSLIMFFVIQPADSVGSGLALVLAGTASSASKFILARNNKHIFNPAALAAALVSLTALQPTTWWIGSSVFWPFTLIFGLAIVRKIKRIPLFATFVGVSVVLQLVLFIAQNQPLGAGIKGSLIASPLLFLSTVMLTEPATMPPRRKQQMLFAALAAVLYVTAWKLGPIYIYPEVALLIGNIYAYAVSPKFRLRLQLTAIQKISDKVYNYVFQPDRAFNFLPGQYMEWTLPGVPYDSRGNRRTFTLASSPTENNVQVGLKYYEPASTYKSTFANLKIGDVVHASQLAGNFTLDFDSTDKLVFIAGGIGITPFRSMVKYFVDNAISRDITLLYVVSDPTEIAYSQDFYEARSIGLRFIPIVTQPGYTANGVVSAKLSQQLITQLVPDYGERTFYISGPPTMVDATKKYLRNLQVPLTNVKTDHFTGY